MEFKIILMFFQTFLINISVIVIGYSFYKLIKEKINKYLLKRVPVCRGYKSWTDCGYEYDCMYEYCEHGCSDCICLTSQFLDFTGLDPRTGKTFSIIKIKRD